MQRLYSAADWQGVYLPKAQAMSVIKLPLQFVGEQGEKTLYALFDSGANLSCINPAQVQGLSTPIRMGRPRKMATASEGHYIEVKEVVWLEFYINDVLLSDEFLLVPGLSEEAIIGAATFQKWRIRLNFETDKVEVDPKVARMQLI
jgi:predicted aspartyl protease